MREAKRWCVCFADRQKPMLLRANAQEIAREKAGIFKLGTPAFTVPQPPDALLALQEVADKVGAPLTVAQPLVQQYRVEGGGSELRMR